MTSRSESTEGAIGEYVTAVIGGQLFGLPISRVQDVFMPERLTRVPLSPGEIAGVLNLRGRIVTVVNMRARLGLPKNDDARLPMAIGVDLRGESYGLLIYQIVEAEDGEKALEVCKRGLPEAILLDWNMPIMDGYEFLGNLRRMPGGDQPKVVFCTTENDVAHIARALHAGANEYIMKPFDKDIVTAKFQEVGLI